MVGLAGYVGCLLYPRFGLPAAEGAGLLALAAAAGFAAFFSPCSFSLLAALLGRTATADALKNQRVRRALGFGAADADDEHGGTEREGAAVMSHFYRTDSSSGSSGPRVRRWGGRVLIALGLWFVALGAFSRVSAVCSPRDRRRPRSELRRGRSYRAP